MALAMVWKYSPDPWLAEPPDPDSLLRLVQVRDLVAGQAWSDLVQARLGGEGGLLMHWSRLVDGPLAAFVLVGGESTAMFAWPLVLYLVFMLAALATARRLGGSAAILPAAVVAVLNIDIITHFIPGRLDHHNVQLALLLVLMAALLRDRYDRKAGAIAGIVMALMLAVGMEALPFVAAAGTFLALAWAFGSLGSGRLAWTGSAFALALLILYPVTVPTGGAALCDAFSSAYLLAGTIGGFGITGLALFAARAPAIVRLAGLAGVGLVAVAAAAFLFPACLAGPMGNVSAELKSEWLDTVAEAQPLWSFASVFPEEAFASFAAPVLATVLAIRRALGGIDDQVRIRWICVAALLLVALVFSIWQYRGSPFLNALSIPVLGVMIADWRRHVEARIKENGKAIAILLVWLSGLQISYLTLANSVSAMAGVLYSAPVGEAASARPAIPLAAADATPAERECIDPASVAALAALPVGRVFSPLFYGPAVLAISPHSALAGPYHRAEGPILDTVRVAAGDAQSARALVRRHGIDYVVICPTSREALLLYQEQPTGFFSGLMLGRQPSWLEAVGTDGTYLMVHRVRRSK